MRTVIALPFLGLFGFFVFVVVAMIAVKAPRFFLSVCGGIVLLILLWVSLSVSPAPDSTRHVLGAQPAHPKHRAPGATVGLSNRAAVTDRQASSGTPAWVLTDDAWSTAPPEWIGTTAARDGDTLTRVVEGELYATPEDANNDALTRAADVAHDYLAQLLGDKVRGWRVPKAYVNDALIQDGYLEAVERDYGEMYRTHLLLKLAPEQRRDLEGLWRHQVVRARIWSAAGGLGLVLLVLTTITGYLKLDEITQGYYSGRLKLAALALLTGGTATLLAVVRSAAG